MPGMYCKTCLYDLTGTPARPGSGIHECPECGRAFDPLKPRTTLRQPLHRWTRFWLNPPWVLAIGFCMLATNALWDPFETKGWWLSFIPYNTGLGLLLLLAWLLRLSIWIALLTRQRNRTSVEFGHIHALTWTAPIWIGLIYAVIAPYLVP